ncbi:xylosyl- and glucuronyltransferase LARGE2s-like isoform X2 [Cylas formicarius]|nr:xylosyl- and glucuronyltransferase LARGE2s-like isoform X2 [Cylas formicarius]
MVLDTDLIATGDIYLLWILFNQFNYKQAIGIVENQSEYYLGRLGKSNPWPALGKGFNSGVMLYDLERMKLFNWNKLWINITRRWTLVYGSVDLGDQDIINALIVENPDIVYVVPCYWNTQLSDNTQSSSCYQEYKPMILHWNSPKKFGVTHKGGELFRSLAASVSQFNGNLLRKFPLMCDEYPGMPTAKVDYTCSKFYVPPNKYYRTFLYFREYNYIPDESDITLVSQLSFDRFYLVEEIASLWTGPISITLYVSDKELAESMQLILDSKILQDRLNISYHAVFKEGDFYPINILRNIGLKNVNTPSVFMVDIDFLPMKDLYESLKDNLKKHGDLNKKAFIVPSFELSTRKGALPGSKLDLINAIDKKEAVPFLFNIWNSGQASTNYKRWRDELHPYKVKWSTDYEPYIVVRSDVTKYDERFFGFGWNRVTHIMELEAQGYEFIVLPNTFIVHKYHKPSYDNMRYRKLPNYRLCLQWLKKTFMEELNKKYNKTFALKASPDYPEYELRRKRDTEQQSTTSLYDSTDYFLFWGGKEKEIAKRKAKRKYPKPPIPTDSVEDYYFYEEEHPYNLTKINLKHNQPLLKALKSSLESVKETESMSESCEQKDYEYDEDDITFHKLHDSTTVPNNNVTMLGEDDLIEKEIDDNESIPYEQLKLVNVQRPIGNGKNIIFKEN